MPCLSTSTTTAPPQGLTSAEVAELHAAGKNNATSNAATRTVGDIVRANVVTRFNFLIAVLLAVIIVVAPIQDALFGIVMVVNAVIGIFQELRAKRTLDRLRLIDAPTVRAVRDGTEDDVAIEEVVEGDLLVVRTGDQIVVDGPIVASNGLEIDESLLTGESDPVSKPVGEAARSGSFVVAGAGEMLAERVGDDAFAARLASEARTFKLASSEIRSGIDTLLKVIGWTLVPVGAILIIGQLTQGFSQAATGAVAGLIAMIPQGLVLLTSMAFAVAVVRLGRHDALVQELPAVETLARVDTICFDKTGTLTQGALRLIATQLITGDKTEIRDALGAVSRLEDQPNATSRLLRKATSDPRWTIEHSVPFSSSRKWSGASFVGRGSWLLGGADVLAPEDQTIGNLVHRHTRAGHRVVALATTPHAISETELPEGLVIQALIVLGDDVRPDAETVLSYFAEQGVDIKVISGDDPSTVAAVAKAAGVVGANKVIDGRNLPEDRAELQSVVERAVIFGRITPHQKKAIVQALQSNGHTVAMTGDGVNDVLALKEADIGIAMGGGSAASRSVSQLVLLDATFSAIPTVMAEGRRVIANIERVSNLFLTKTVYAIALAVAASAAQLAFPFLPRQLSLIGALTIGIPSFFLALEATSTPARSGFLTRIWRFALPTGIIAAAATFGAYGLARNQGVSLAESRTTATIVLVAVGIFALLVVGRPLNFLRQTLALTMASLFVLTLVLDSWRQFFELPMPSAVVAWAAIGIAAATGALMYAALQLSGWIIQGGVRSFVTNATTWVREVMDDNR